jgi:hypothetical protein
MDMHKERRIAEAIAQREAAHVWRSTADSIYARAVFARIVQPMMDQNPEWTFAEIAEELRLRRIPRVRGTAPWAGKDVSALIARVAAMAHDVDDPASWGRTMERLAPDVGAGLDSDPEIA